MPQSSASRIITQAGRDLLQPFGLFQKGKSRTWLDDHGWWVIVVEFQPSSRSSDTYLNVGISWLLFEKDCWAFDYGINDYRDRLSIRFLNEAQFEQSVNRLASHAIDRVTHFRNLFPSTRSAKEALLKSEDHRPWGLYYTGVLVGLCGDVMTSQRYLARLLEEEAVADWHKAIQDQASALVPCVANTQEFKTQVVRIVHTTRQKLHLKAWDSEFWFD